MPDIHNQRPERFCICCGGFLRGDYLVIAIDALGFVDAHPSRPKDASPEVVSEKRGIISGTIDFDGSYIAYVCWSCRSAFESRTSLRGPEIAPPEKEKVK